MAFEVLSTRLFPKLQGADRYAVTGIAARCDWVVLSDPKPPAVHLRRQVDTETPRHVFLSLRGPFAALRYFVQRVLPQIHAPFVLISGSEDVTVPNQIDRRWRRFGKGERAFIREILDHPHLRRWAAENLDEAIHPRLVPLPVGMVFPDATLNRRIDAPDVPSLGSRPLGVLCAHRVRTGPQWEPRRTVTALARAHWSEWCTIREEEMPEEAFSDLMRQHAFVLCVEGGGLDPSPKAWTTLLHGAIPIVRENALAPAYHQLPVAFVKDWTPEALTPERLAAWHARFAPEQDTPAARARVLARLGLDFWWDRVSAGV